MLTYFKNAPTLRKPKNFRIKSVGITGAMGIPQGDEMLE